jgi:hypothetical protein
MRRLAFGSIFTVALCSIAYLIAPESSAQTSGSCPTDFEEVVTTQSADALDLNLDGRLCASQPSASSNGVVERMFVENGASLCGCPPGFFPASSKSPFPGFDARADRNGDYVTCAKMVPPNSTVGRFVIIDNRRGGPNQSCGLL